MEYLIHDSMILNYQLNFSREGVANWETFFINRGHNLLWMMKNTVVLMATMPSSSARYYINDQSKCSDDVRFIGKDKYPKKILMWIAMSNRVMSKP